MVVYELIALKLTQHLAQKFSSVGFVLVLQKRKELFAGFFRQLFYCSRDGHLFLSKNGDDCVDELIDVFFCGCLDFAERR